MKRYTNIIAILIALISLAIDADSQNVGINGTGAAPNSSAMLDVSSTTKGMLIPRMTHSQRNSISSPATGLLVYLTDSTTGFYYYNGSTWQFTLSGTASLTSNGIAYGNGTGAVAVTAAGSQGQTLTVNSLGVPVWSSTTYPCTTTANQLLYSSGTNTVTGLSTSSNGILITNSSGVPAWLASGTNGQVLTTNSSGVPTWATASTAGTWSLTGNSGTAPGTNYIGTSDNEALVFKVNGQSSGRIDNTYLNTFFGYKSGYNVSTGEHNVLLGNKSGYTQTTAAYNTFVGDSSGYNNTANGNVFVGYAAGTANTSANQNSFVGYQSGYKTSTGSNNSFLGYQSGYSNTTGSNNTAMGTSSLRDNTTAGENTAVGNSALFTNTTGGYNVAMGYKAGYSQTVSKDNTFIGDSVGYAVTSSCNTMLGYIAATNVTTGYGNTAVGNQAGTTITTGSHNTFIGDSANAAAATYSNATAIGFNASVGESNAIVLGNGADVGIGTSTPGNFLEINSGTGGVSGLRLKEMPSGAILFMSSTNDVSENNNNLFFDATNYRLGVACAGSASSTIQDGGSLAVAISTKTASYTAGGSDHTLLCNTAAGSINILLPAVTGCTGRIYIIKKISSDANTVSVNSNGGTLIIDGASSYTLASQYNSIMIQSDGTNWDILATH